MANKDGSRLERICVGPQEKMAPFEIVRRMGFKDGLQTSAGTHIHILLCIMSTHSHLYTTKKSATCIFVSKY
jgi:hypothetical protein